MNASGFVLPNQTALYCIFRMFYCISSQFFLFFSLFLRVFASIFPQDCLWMQEKNRSGRCQVAENCNSELVASSTLANIKKLNSVCLAWQEKLTSDSNNQPHITFQTADGCWMACDGGRDSNITAISLSRLRWAISCLVNNEIRWFFFLLYRILNTQNTETLTSLYIFKVKDSPDWGGWRSLDSLRKPKRRCVEVKSPEKPEKLRLIRKLLVLESEKKNNQKNVKFNPWIFLK